MSAGIQYEWGFVLTFALLTSIGILVGSRFAAKFDGVILRKIFGWFVLAIGVAVLVRETTRLM